MSQFPPPPPGSMPPQPPMGGGPYGQQPFPPAGGYGQQPQPSKTNGWALASLIVGFVGFCLPFIGGLVAVVLGVVGIAKARPPQGGKGMAIAGLLLGLVSLGVYVLFSGAIFAFIKGTETQREVARQFITDLAAGNVDAAEAATDGTISREQLEDWSKTMQGWGKLNDTTIVGVSAEPGKTQIGGSATFGSTPRGFEALVIKQPDGSYKVSDLTMK